MEDNSKKKAVKKTVRKRRSSAEVRLEKYDKLLQDCFIAFSVISSNASRIKGILRDYDMTDSELFDSLEQITENSGEMKSKIRTRKK